MKTPNNPQKKDNEGYGMIIPGYEIWDDNTGDEMRDVDTEDEMRDMGYGRIYRTHLILSLYSGFC